MVSLLELGLAFVSTAKPNSRRDINVGVVSAARRKKKKM
jgi:hypothetical protein